MITCNPPATLLDGIGIPERGAGRRGLGLALHEQARGHARLGEHRDCCPLDQAAGTLAAHPDPAVPKSTVQTTSVNRAGDFGN